MATEALHLDVPDVDAVDGDPALANVVEPRYEVDQARLPGAGGAQDGDFLAGLGSEAYVREDWVPAVVTVAERHVLEDDSALNFVHGDCTRPVLDLGNRVQDLHNAPGGGVGGRDLARHHAEHHDGEDGAEEVVDKSHYLADAACTREHLEPAEVDDGDGAKVENRHHDGEEHAHELGDPEGDPVELKVRRLEPPALVVPPDEGLDHPDAGEVLLEHLVQVLDALLDTGEEGLDDPDENCDQDQGQGEQGEHHGSEPKVGGEHYADATYEHQRRHGEHSEAHADDHLDLVYVAGEPCQELPRGEVVEVAEAICLYLLEHRLPQVRLEAPGGPHRENGVTNHQRSAQDAYADHQEAGPQDEGHVSHCDAVVDDDLNEPRDRQLSENINGHEDGGDDGLPLVG